MVFKKQAFVLALVTDDTIGQGYFIVFINFLPYKKRDQKQKKETKILIS